MGRRRLQEKAGADDLSQRQTQTISRGGCRIEFSILSQDRCIEPPCRFFLSGAADEQRYSRVHDGHCSAAHKCHNFWELSPTLLPTRGELCLWASICYACLVCDGLPRAPD